MLAPFPADAVAAARRIRKVLVQQWRRRQRGPRNQPVSLEGECFYASCLLADVLGRPETLRHVCTDGWAACHVFNVVDGYIIDITATQFRRCRGVLVARATAPAEFHRPLVHRGPQVVTEWLGHWSTVDFSEYPRSAPAMFKRLMER